MSEMISGLNVTSEQLFLVGVILFLVDIFFVSDILAIIAFVLFATAVCNETDVGALYKIILGLVIFFTLVSLHYAFFRKVIQNLVHKYIAPRKYASHTSQLIGKTGTIEEIDGIHSIRIEGQLWGFHNESDLALEKDMEAKVLNFRDGKVVI